MSELIGMHLHGAHAMFFF